VSAINRTLHRYNTERELEENLLTYATILDNSSDGMIATDVNDRVRFMNPAAERLTGWSMRAARGQPSSAVLRFARTAGQADNHAVRRVLASRGTVKLGAGKYLMSRFGGYTPVDGAVSAVIDSLDRLVGATISLRDVTDVRNQTAALRDAVEQLRAIMDTAVDGVMLIDTDGKILMFNAACSTLFGYTSQEMAGMTIAVIIPDGARDAFDWPLRPRDDDPVAARHDAAHQTTGRRKDGTRFPAELTLGKASQRGRAVFVGVIRDVSERTELEAALLDAVGREQRRLGDDLHDGVGQELTGLALLLSSYARELHLGQSLDAKDLEVALQVAQRALQSCRDIARGLSPVTEAQGGLIVGLRELVDRMTMATGPRLTFETSGPTRLGLSPAASGHLFRIAQEALANALKHADAKSIRVMLDVEPSSVRLTVCDDGKGLTIPPISAPGLGLRTMRYRASVLGARLQISQWTPSGTCIVCECPRTAD
jgi:two-component system CheB/CheR fusion protein